MGIRSPGVLEASRDAVDGEEEQTFELLAFSGVVGGGAAQGGQGPQLQVREGVDVGVAEGDGAGQDGAVGQQAVVLGDGQDQAAGQVVLGQDAGRGGCEG